MIYVEMGQTGPWSLILKLGLGGLVLGVLGTSILLALTVFGQKLSPKLPLALCILFSLSIFACFLCLGTTETVK